MFHPGAAVHGAGGVGCGRRGLQPGPGELAASLAPGGCTPSVRQLADAGTALPDDFLVGHDLVSVFQVGWTVLHADVCMYAAERLIEVLTRLRCHDLETQAGLDALRVEMARHWQAGTPWRAREALDVIAILDLPAWAALLGLIDECPVMHAAIGASRGFPHPRGQRRRPSSSFRRTARSRPSASSCSRCRRHCAADGDRRVNWRRGGFAWGRAAVVRDFVGMAAGARWWIRCFSLGNPKQGPGQ